MISFGVLHDVAAFDSLMPPVVHGCALPEGRVWWRAWERSAELVLAEPKALTPRHLLLRPVHTRWGFAWNVYRCPDAVPPSMRLQRGPRCYLPPQPLPEQSFGLGLSCSILRGSQIGWVRPDASVVWRAVDRTRDAGLLDYLGGFQEPQERG